MPSPLDDLFDGPLPTSFQDLVGRFTTDGVTSTVFAPGTANSGTQHSGTLKSAQTDPIRLGFGELELPGITAGTPFRLAIFDAPAGRWHLDIVLDGLSLKLNDLHGADFVKEAGTTPRRLVRRATDTAVIISGDATIRFAKASDAAPVVVQFVENSSAADPLANSGGVVGLRCNPPHFFFGTSQFGMTLTALLFDFSDSFSPPYIIAQGQTPQWIGFAIAEATLYAPPNAIGRGGFSGGVRNLLLGSPRGIQGEFEVQWGRSPLDPSTFAFLQAGQPVNAATGTGTARLVTITAGQDEPVAMTASFIASQPPQGGSAANEWRATWRWPDGTESNGPSSTATVAHGQVLRVVPEEHVTGQPVVRHPEVSFRFIASGGVPEIDVDAGGATVANVIHVAGPKASITGLTFRARSTAATPGTFRWKLGANGTEQTGAAIMLAAGDVDGDRQLVLREVDGAGRSRVTRLRVQATEAVPLLIGAENGIVDAAMPAAPLTPSAVEGTFDLTDYHALARFRPILDDAEIDAAIPARVDVPAGALAVVTIAGAAAPPPPMPTARDRHVDILFDFNSGSALSWGDYPPTPGAAAAADADFQRQLLAWAANFPGASFLVVGRCDDLGNNALNVTLAHARRDTALRFLTSVPAGSALAAVPVAQITSWGEQDGQPGTVTASPLDVEEAAAQRLIVATDNGTGAALTDRSGWPATRDTAHAAETTRRTFRRVDIHAVGGTPTAAAAHQPVAAARAPDLRRMMMPGDNVDPAPAVTATPAMDYRVKLLAGWDKPSGDGWKDLIPSKAEFEYAWSPDDQPLPDLGGDPVTLEVLTVYGNWRHDDTSGFTKAQIGIRSDGDPDGLVKIDQQNLVAAMALGPVLLSGVNSTTDTFEKAGRLAALAAGTAFAKVSLGPGGPLVGTASKTVIKSIEATAELKDIDAVGDDYKISLTSSYTTTLHINTGSLGLRTDPAHPVKFRYNNVGIVFDPSKTDLWDKIAVNYPTDALTIEDPGKWKIDGVLGSLLRAVETALGVGSLWTETRFAFALTIGVVEISEAVIRVTFKGGASPLPEFSLRGLVAKVDIPATVKGEGRLRIEDPGGVIKAGIDLEVIPLQLKASAAFAMASFTTPEPFTFVNLFAKVQFPVGIPLGPSGAALHGFIGQTVINGERDVIVSDDIVAREIGWWRKMPEDKYRPLKNQHALGLGVVVGTLPDASFSLSATGMIVVAFPDPEVILAVEINILSVPDRTAKDKKDGPSGTITGLIVIDDTAVAIAAQARYEIPEVLRVVVPFAAYFPYSGNGVYVRIGSDGQMGRSGEPVTVTLLPSTINLQAFAYLMIEQNGLPKLGGRPDFSFQGFSVGFGAGAGLEWSAGPIKLSASILLLAGFGTDPLLIKAGIFVRGELDLVVVSIAARGEIILTYQQGAIWMDGEFCGEVDLFFFSLEGCVSFRIGNPAAIAVADPAPPVASVMLTDRGGRVMGEALRGGGALAAQPLFRFAEVGGKVVNTGVAPKDNHTVWADTVPVINFSHFIDDLIPDGRQFNPIEQPSGERWFGSNRLKYTYRLDDVRLVRNSDGVVVAGSKALQSVWCTSPARQPGSGGPVQPSGLEVISLRLLDWQPWGWALPMADGGASAPGNPAETIGNLCVPIPQPARACLFGRDARGAGPNRIRLLHESPPPGPYPSFFTLVGRPGLRVGATIIEGSALITLLAGAGAQPIAGNVVALSQPVSGPMGPLFSGYRLPGAQVATPGAVRQRALPWLADLDRTIRRGRLLLLVCDGGSRGGDRPPANCYRFDGLSIGKVFTKLDVTGFTLEAMTPQAPFTVTDEVDLAQGNPTLGADRQPDIRIASPGLIIRPRTPVRTLDLHFYRTEALGTKIEWVDSSGQSGDIMEPGAAKGAVSVRVAATADIKEIRIHVRAPVLHLTEICGVGGDQAGTCFDFADAKPDAVARGRFRHGGIDFEAIDTGVGLRLVDNVDARATPARQGSDGTMDLRFPEKGVELRLGQAATSVSIGVWSGGRAVTAVAFDSAGNAVAQAQDAARVPVELRLEAREIVRVIVSGGSNEAVIWRVCQGTSSSETCLTFGREPKRRLATLALDGLTITPAMAGETLTLVDVVTDVTPVTVGGDGKVELFIPETGLIFTPAAPLGGLAVYVAMLADEKVKAVAYDAGGNKVATDAGGGDADALVRLRLVADAIVRVELRARGKAFVTRVCMTPQQGGTGVVVDGQARNRVAGATLAASGLPVVSTLHANVLHPWTPQLVGSIASPDGGVCRIVAYDQPAATPDAGSFQIVSPTDTVITLLSLCGVDSRADQARAEDVAAQAALQDVVDTVATADITEAAREVLLEPGEAYRIEVAWSWQHWSSNDAGTDSPPATPPAAGWKTGTLQSFRFQVAAEELAGSDTQDGLNEYLFDPRDITRYLSRTEPADGRDVVFTDDPLWVHFSAGHVVNLVERYGRELTLDVRRTDPPPQPNAAARELVMTAPLLETFYAKGPKSVQTAVELLINQAVIDAPCLADGPVVGGASIGARFALVPNAMYDFNLLATKTGADPVVVNATRFKTSRYANPDEMLEALGFGMTTPAPFAPDEILLGDAMVLPNGPLVVSDLDLGTALAAIGADTLPLPGDRGRVIALWKRTGASYGIAGILIDSPEPMRREAAVLQGSAAVDAVRCTPAELSVNGIAFVPVRATFNWTRVLFVAAAPVVPAGADPQLSFRLDVAPGPARIGRRIVRTRPMMLETEGF